MKTALLWEGMIQACTSNILYNFHYGRWHYGIMYSLCIRFVFIISLCIHYVFIMNSLCILICLHLGRHVPWWSMTTATLALGWRTDSLMHIVRPVAVLPHARRQEISTPTTSLESWPSSFWTLHLSNYYAICIHDVFIMHSLIIMYSLCIHYAPLSCKQASVEGC